MKKIKLFMVFSAVLLLASCTVEKRRYTDGYHVEWHRKSDKPLKVETPVLSLESKSDAVAQTVQNEEVIATVQAENEPTQIESPSKPADVKITTQKSAKPAKKQDVKHVKNEEQTVTAKRVFSNDVHNANVNLLENSNDASRSDEDLILLVILSFLVPPLAVYLFEGSWTDTVTINLILSLLFLIPGIVHALIVILG